MKNSISDKAIAASLRLIAKHHKEEAEARGDLDDEEYLLLEAARRLEEKQKP